MQRSWHRWIAIAVLSACVSLPARQTSAQEAGWSTSTDPRKRIFLSYRPAKDGPRTLLLGCLRDVDTFTIMSEGVADAASSGQKAMLTLANGAGRYAVDGEVSPDPDTGTPSFSTDIDLDAQTVRQLRSGLLPVLEGKGAIQLSMGSAYRELPMAGLPAALKRFKSVCFGMQ
jgi:hypothetical protein